ncbi:PaREP1 family protein [Vulcanisaeta distributa]|uniref:PaREP1 family protein n=1 Tax=Vulcanisaeta distributa (strain DSM 14429 / JCM 11212 / NBRC 100878 / IC-017) TaxID=572478 RepID=E1QUW6_VULDI|nr:PaREP1 family protein [Vulcanisaeta distributa]ADN49969.1 PaREP1 family protein [Vulcanisaeta distributa DSM 14429]
MEELLRLINEESRKRGVTTELFLADLLAQRLDPKDRVYIYLKIHEELLKHSDEEYVKGDLVQASEKLWGAVAALLNAIAEARGWEHYSHRDYDVIINRLFRETGDKDLPLYFGAAERLHANFYHNFMTKDEYELHREYVLRLINKLRDLLKR